MISNLIYNHRWLAISYKKYIITDDLSAFKARDKYEDEKNKHFDYTMFHFRQGTILYGVSCTSRVIADSAVPNENFSPTKVLSNYFLTSYMESKFTMSPWLWSSSSPSCLDTMVSCNNRIWKWNYSQVLSTN